MTADPAHDRDAAGRRFLLITSVLPWPLRHNGGAQRTALLRDALARHGRVDVLMVTGATLKEEPPDLATLAAAHNVVGYVVRAETLAPKPWYLPGPLGSVASTVKKYQSAYEPDRQAAARLESLMASTRYDLIVSRYLAPALQAGVARYPAVPAVLDFDDIDWLTLASQIAAKPWGGVTGPLASRRVLARVTALAKAALGHFRHVWVTSDEDAREVPCPTSVLPNIPFCGTRGEWLKPLPPAAGSRELLFVGDLQFPPNRDGLDRFLTRVWPLVRSCRADATLSIVGRGCSEAVRARWSASPGVTVVGFADDLQDCYRRCAFSVVPIYFGGGTKIKVLESLAYGRTVVTTPEAMRGYGALGSACVAVGATDEALATHVVRLLNDTAVRDAMARSGRAVVEREFSPARFDRIVEAVVADVLAQR